MSTPRVGVPLLSAGGTLPGAVSQIVVSFFKRDAGTENNPGVRREQRLEAAVTQVSS